MADHGAGNKLFTEDILVEFASIDNEYFDWTAREDTEDDSEEEESILENLQEEESTEHPENILAHEGRFTESGERPFQCVCKCSEKFKQDNI